MTSALPCGRKPLGPPERYCLLKRAAGAAECSDCPGVAEEVPFTGPREPKPLQRSETMHLREEDMAKQIQGNRPCSGCGRTRSGTGSPLKLNAEDRCSRCVYRAERGQPLADKDDPAWRPPVPAADPPDVAEEVIAAFEDLFSGMEELPPPRDHAPNPDVPGVVSSGETSAASSAPPALGGPDAAPPASGPSSRETAAPVPGEDATANAVEFNGELESYMVAAINDIAARSGVAPSIVYKTLLASALAEHLVGRLLGRAA